MMKLQGHKIALGMYQEYLGTFGKYDGYETALLWACDDGRICHAELEAALAWVREDDAMRHKYQLSQRKPDRQPTLF